MNLATLSSAAALVLAAAGVLLAALTLAATRRPRPALGVLLDLLLGAGLLRLTFLDTWTAIAGAAALVAIRKLVVLALTSDSRRRVRAVAAPAGATLTSGTAQRRWRIR
ncbi:hypothetical protein [Angustibacter sp. Root456]|uniref:hypothetical protein n=1 Tax=Angustibacter sp. Root456 TaxID=1736539 RepID=UPI0019109751|nr:hypothetical protein [Angustibacter sp. Root456]